jgi:pimeloyl-ACP methyl ester carboxylesterase
MHMRGSRKLMLGALLGVLALACGALLAVTRPPHTPRIAGERAVASLEKVRLGEFEQWISVRGEDARNPVLLFLHGGPGMSAMYLAHAFQRELERDFVVVHWDRLGAGKSYRDGLPPHAISVESEIQDARQLCAILRARFGNRPVLLLGHSYGSYLGVRLAQRHPELFVAYIGVGQVTDPVQERRVQRDFLARAAAQAGDRELVRQLQTGAPVDIEAGLFQYGAELHDARSWWPLVWIGLRSPEYSVSDVLNVQKGVQFTQKHMKYDHPTRAISDVVALDLPVFLLQGRHDYTTPSVLGEQWLSHLAAPRKELVWFEESAHFPFLEEPAKFAAELRRISASLHPPRTARSAGAPQTAG